MKKRVVLLCAMIMIATMSLFMSCASSFDDNRDFSNASISQGTDADDDTQGDEGASDSGNNSVKDDTEIDINGGNWTEEVPFN